MRINKDKIYTTEEVAEILKVSAITIKRYVAENKINSIKFNGLRRFKGGDVLNIINNESKRAKKYVENNPYCWTKSYRITSPQKKCNRRHKVIDLFSGAGGASVGFSQAGFGIALGVDNHMPSKSTFTKNHRESMFILGDIRKIKTELINKFSSSIKPSVIIAGVPCQGFSLNNRKRIEDDERNFLFKEFIRFVKVFEPNYVLLENVSGIRSSGNGYFVEAIKMEIGECGYDVDFKVLKAADYGVPQRRTRIFFMGVKPGYKIRWPSPTYGPALKKYCTIYDAISDLPELSNGQEIKKYDKKPMTEYQRLMRKNSGKLLFNHRAPNHPQSTIKRISSTPPGKPMYEKFPQRIRLKYGDLSPTQVSGGIRSQFTFGHPEQPRGLSIRERARLQSFPDDFVFCGGLVQERVQTGNAIPPLLAHAIADQIMKGLKNEPIDQNTITKSPAQMALIK